MKQIILLGDTHCLNFLHRLPLDFKDFILIGLGDHGEHRELNQKHLALHDIQLLNDYCERNNGELYLTRGNHSNPAWFNANHWANSLPLVTFVPDNTVIDIQGNRVLFSGGATSIDRKTSTLGFDYWVEEKFKPVYKDYGEIDVLITHAYVPAELTFTRIQHYIDADPELKDELLAEIEEQRIFHKHVAPKKGHFYGHYHFPNLQYDENNCRIQCLDIDELFNASRLLQ